MKKKITLGLVFLTGLLFGSMPANSPITFSGMASNSLQLVQDFWAPLENPALGICAYFDTQYGVTSGTCASMMDPCIPGTVASATCTEDNKTAFSITFNPIGTFSVTVP